MSMQTWIDEFYPITAEEAARGSAKDATVHSIRKWEGLRPSALAKHGCTLIENTLYDVDDRRLVIASNSCALCVKFYSTKTYCRRCPLAKARDGTPCDKHMLGERIAPYFELTESPNGPEPMIAWLGKALSECK
jgi:hypothetical protein